MATYVPVPSSGTLTLRRRSSCSFDGNDPALLTDWLTQRGYRPIPSRSELEYVRLRRSDELIVIYTTGTALCQGSNAAGAVAVLSELEGVQP